MPFLTLLTDFGTTDYYVGAVKGTVLRLLGERASGAQLVDLSHDLAAGDLEAAADLLAAAAPTFPAGTVHLAVVDPGVGSERRILAVRSEGHLFVAPDNGLLTPFLPPVVASGDVRIRNVTRAELFLDGPGATFHGRDRFAPTAAALLRGEPLESLGPTIDDPVRLERPAPGREPTPEGAVLHGRVVRLDRFGNLVTDIPADWLPDDPGPEPDPEVQLAGQSVRRWITHYAELPEDEPGALVGSLGTVELSLRGRSLAERWKVRRGEPVRLLLRGETARRPGPRGEAEPTRWVGGAGPAGRYTAREPEPAPGSRSATRRGEGGRKMTKWEYKIINIRSENYRLDPNAAPQLSALGAEGWELVGLTSVNFKSGATDNIAMVFKRPVD